MIIRFFLTLLLVASVACSESPFTPTSPESTSNSLTLTSETLSGTWSLSSVQPAGQAQQATPRGANYALTFNDGRMSARADCNTCVGSYTLSGQTLTAGPALACTRAACPTMAFENTYTSLLSGEHTVTTSGNTLVLSSPRGLLRFSRQ
jgi:heat shock protein HslJ